MARPAYGGCTTCESCKSIDVRVWHRGGRLRARQYFSWSWTYGGKSTGYINVRTELDAVVLVYRVRCRDAAEWKSIEQRVPITWTGCHFGGQRPWFICSVYSNGRYCGRRVAVLYGAGEFFACRRCYQLAYVSQQLSPRHRTLRHHQKIRMRLGGCPNLLEPFPPKPSRMHMRTYLRLKARAQAAEATSLGLTQRWIDRLKRAR
jgi:hypothetical protein